MSHFLKYMGQYRAITNSALKGKQPKATTWSFGCIENRDWQIEWCRFWFREGPGSVFFSRLFDSLKICVGWSPSQKKVSRTGLEPAIIGRQLVRLRNYATLNRLSLVDFVIWSLKRCLLRYYSNVLWTNRHFSNDFIDWNESQIVEC